MCSSLMCSAIFSLAFFLRHCSASSEVIRRACSLFGAVNTPSGLPLAPCASHGPPSLEGSSRSGPGNFAARHPETPAYGCLETLVLV